MKIFLKTTKYTFSFTPKCIHY